MHGKNESVRVDLYTPTHLQVHPDTWTIWIDASMGMLTADVALNYGVPHLPLVAKKHEFFTRVEHARTESFSVCPASWMIINHVRMRRYPIRARRLPPAFPSHYLASCPCTEVIRPLARVCYTSYCGRETSTRYSIYSWPNGCCSFSFCCNCSSNSLWRRVGGLENSEL